MRKIWIVAALVAVAGLLSSAPAARADMFGGDDAILSGILGNAISQLTSLNSILKTGSDQMGLLQAINQGINDSLAMAQSLGIHIDPGIYGQVSGVGQASSTIDGLFGATPESPLAPVERSTDQTAAEAIAFHNDLYSYADRIDSVGENIKSYSHAVSPGGAAKLTAESIGVLIHVANQQLRASGTSLKLQAQALAVQNKREKDQTAEYLREGQTLKAQMTTAQPNFTVPRF